MGRRYFSGAASGGAPSGAAGGDLDDTYPDPSVVALTEAGGMRLPIGAIAEGQNLRRVGDELVGNTPATGVTKELRPAVGVENDTKFTWGGAPVYSMRFTGVMPAGQTGTLIAGVLYPIQILGFFGTTTDVKICPGLTGSSQVFAQVDAAANLTLVNGGTTFDGGTYDVVIWYVKI